MSFEKIGRYKPAENVTVRPDGKLLTDQLKAARFVAITGYGKDRSYLASHAAAGDAHPFGVTQRESANPANEDEASGDLLVECMTGGIPFVEAGEEIVAPADIAVGPEGKAVNADAAVAAALKTGVVGENNALNFAALTPGVGGNLLSVALIDPAGNNKVLAVNVDGHEIKVSLATDAEGKITSTGAQVIAAIAEHDTASQLIVATNQAGSSGAGKVKAVAKTNLADGTDSTGGGLAVAKALTSAEEDGDFIEAQLYR